MQAIDDDSISCQIPTTPPSAGLIDGHFSTISIKHAQISSTVAKRLSNVYIVHQTATDIIKTVVELDKMLYDYKQSISCFFDVDASIDPSQLPSGISLQQAVYLQYSFYGTLCDIHSVLTYPWFHNILSLNQDPAVCLQLEVSSQRVAKASRSILVATKHVHIDAAAPAQYGPALKFSTLLSD